MPNNNESTRWLYGQLSRRGYNVGKDLAEFENLMNTNSESRKWAYDTARGEGLDVGRDQAEFDSLVAPDSAAGAGNPSAGSHARQVVEEYDESVGRNDGDTGIDSAAVKPTVAKNGGIVLPDGFGRLDTRHFTDNKGMYRAGWDEKPDLFDGPTAVEQTVRALNGDREAMRQEKPAMDSMNAQLRDRLDYMRETGTELKDPVVDMTQFGIAPSLDRFESGGLRMVDGKPVVGHVNDEVRAGTQRIDSERLRRADLQRQLEEAEKELDALNNEAAKMSSPGYIYEQDALSPYADPRTTDGDLASLSTAMKQTQERIDGLKRQLSGGNTTIMRGIADGLADVDMWTLGLTSLGEGMNMARVAKQIRGGHEADSAEALMIDAIIKNGDVQQALEENSTMGYRGARMFGQMLPFMGQIMVTGGFGGVADLGSAAGRRWAKDYIKKHGAEAFRNRMAANILKGTGVALGDIAAGFANATTLGIGNTMNDALQRYAGQAAVDESGDYTFAGGDELWRALGKALTSQTKEFATERFGEHLPGVGQIGGWIGRLPKMSMVSRAMSGLAGNKVMRKTSEWLRKGGINGLGSEIMEEEIGLPIDVALGDMTWDEAFSGRTQGDIVFGLAMSVGAMQGIGAAAQGIGKFYNTAQYRRYKKRTDDAGKAASSRLTEEAWTPLKEKIDNTPNEGFGEVWDEVRGNESLSEQEKRAVYDYMNSLATMRGYALGGLNGIKEKARRDAFLSPEEQQNVHEDGMIHAAVMFPNADNGGQQQEVFVVKGNVVLREDGTVDASASDDVIYYKGADGQTHSASPDKFESVSEPVSIEEYAQAKQVAGDGEAVGAESQAESFAVGQEVGVIVDGVARPATVQGFDGNGNVNVYYQDADGMDRSAVFTEEELRGMNGNAENFQQNEEESKGNGNNGGDNIPQNGNIEPQNIPASTETLQADGGTLQAGAGGQSALERIPKDEQGQPIYEQSDPDTAWDAIVEQTEGDEAMAQNVADSMVADKEAELKKVEKSKPKGGTTIAEKIASERERKNAVEQAKANLALWQKIAQTSQRRKQAALAEQSRQAEEAARLRREQEERERVEREEAERIRREALNGVPDIIDDTPQDARARGYRRVNGEKVDRQVPLAARQGKEVQVKFDDKNIPTGHLALIEAGQLQPSHINGRRNPFHFIDEAQPKERNDEASVMSARRIAANIRPEEITSSVTAYTGAPTVNTRGEVIQGNNRSAALREMWAGQPEQAAVYKQYLTEHAADFGLAPEDVEAMQQPVLVNMVDVPDDEAISLGQFVAQDTESGGTERIKPKNIVQKMGDDMKGFAGRLLASPDEEMTFSELVDRNGMDVLKWMQAKNYITPTQYRSAFDSKGNLTGEAKNDLKGIMYQSIFQNGNTHLEEMFGALPAKAQKAILATAYRDYDSPNSERMNAELQASINAYYALSQMPDFANAKNYKEARKAAEAWKRQLSFDDVTGESYLPSERYSNFALLLATMYKGQTQVFIQNTLKNIFDLVQGTKEATLFEEPDNTPRTLVEAVNETMNGLSDELLLNENFIYNGQRRNNVLAGGSAAGQQGRQGSTRDDTSGGRTEGGTGIAADNRGTEGGVGQEEVERREAELASRVQVNDDDWQEGNGESPTYKRSIIIDGTHTATQIDEPDENGHYTGSYFEFDNKRFGDIAEIVNYIDNGNTLASKIAQAEAETDQNPTEAQKEAGNYKKGHVRIGQFDITVENPKGSVRRGTDASGKAWEQTMQNTYGYIRGTEGVDGDHIDVFLTNDIDGWNGRRVYVVDQYNEDGTFDEHKVMLGFNDEAEAQDAYLSNYEKGWSFKRKLVMSSANLEDFEKWINSSYRKTKPFAEYKSVSRENDENRVTTGGDDLAARVREILWEIRKPKMVDVISGEDDLALRTSYLPPNTISKVRQAINYGAVGYYDSESDVIFLMSGNVRGDEDIRRFVYHEHVHSALVEQGVDIDRALAALREERPDLLAEATKRVDNTDLYDDFETDDRNEEILVYAIDHLVADGVVMNGDGKFTDIYNNIFNALRNGEEESIVHRATPQSSEKNSTSSIQPIREPESYGQGESLGVAGESDFGRSLPTNDRGRRESQGKRGEATYSIEPAQYTTKRGKVLGMFLVTFAEPLSQEQQRAARELAKAEKGWYDRDKGGFMMRSEESARKLADTITGNEEVLSDAQPLSLADTRKLEEPVMRQVDVEGLMQAIQENGEAKLSDHFVPQLEQKEETSARKEETSVQETESSEQNEENAYGANNKLVSRERYEELKARMRRKLGGQLNMGIDPEILAIGTEMAAYHIEAGARKFADYATHMIADLGDAIRPYLKSFYNGARDLPEVQEAGLAGEMTPYDEVRTFDVANFDKGHSDVLATAEMVVQEQEADSQADVAKDKLINQRNEQRRKENEQTTADTTAIASKAESVASKAESDIEAATTEQQVNNAVESIDKQLEEVNKQLALLGYYEAEPVESDFNEAYGYMRNAEKKAVKDANRLAKRLVNDLGIDPDTIVDKKGKKRRSIATANIAPAGGDISIYLPLSSEANLYLSIGLAPTYERNALTPLIDRGKGGRWEGDNLEVEHIMYRIEQPNANGSERYGNNNFADTDVTYPDLLKDIRRISKKYIPIKEDAKEGKGEKNSPKDSKNKKKTVSSQTQVADLFGGLFEENASTESASSQDNELNRKFAMTVKDDMLAALDNDTKPYRSILDLRKRAIGLGMEVDNDGRTDILLQELVEDGLVRAAREVAERHGSDSRETYDLICKLYEMQPTIAARSSNRIKMQQYSTPLPMAWNATRFAMIGKKDGKVLEPTAGNGMLVFAVPANQVYVNELDETRLDNLREQGFAQVTQQDATEPFEGGQQYDVIIANPPFGKRDEVEYDGKMIPGLDPQITLNALASMKDNGKAAIIIGGNMEYGNNGGLKSMKPFFTYLYDHYNVKGVVDMDGKLYSKQGTTFPTRMILIAGRRSNEERAQTAVYPPIESKAIRKADSFDDLYDIINEVINSKEKTNGTEILRSQQGQLVSVADQPSRNADGKRHTEQSRKDDTSGRGRRASVEGTQKQGEVVLRGEHRTDTGNGEARRGTGGNTTGGSRGVPEPDVQRVGRVGVSTDRVGLELQRTAEQPKKRGLSEEKLPYRPHNSAFSLESVAPAAMVEAMDRTLSQIEKKHGHIDEFVRKELGYDTTDELHQALAAEQVDSVAMAIYQMKQGQALIIGDQTGVGKGRQMAALIRWAVRQGEKPIFITQKADLFSDIYRDLVDIGSGDLVPFIFNSPSAKENKGEMVDANGKVVYKGLSDAKMKKVLATGKLPDECDYAVLTYSQVNTGDEVSQKEMEEAAKKNKTRSKKSKSAKDGKATPKATFLRSIAEDNYLFLDESHTAAGSSNTGAYLQSILRSAKAATFASATFAKRPDTMPLYAIRTAMSQAKVEPDKLIGIIEKGGVTLQEIMSRELTNAGQMVRRERDMSDVVTDWKTINDPATVKRARENYDRTIAAFNAIIKFQEDYVKPMVDAMDKELAIMAESAGIKRGTDKMGVENVPFASKTYNYTKQLMLALKVDAIANEVDAEIKAGRHPVIALESTMESSIKDYSAGEVIAEPTFSASLLRGLATVMQYTIKDENGKEQHARYTPKQLGEAGEKAYYELQEFIRESTSDIFISPLDAIIERLHEMGYKVGELTGRNLYVERDNEGRVVVKRRTDKDKKRMQREFNNGELDVLILNKSASTGISLHASEKFSDQRQRTMIIAQPLSDINDYMQMIGRIDRTGQVHRGYYINLGLPVPAENRFLMMLSTKLKSLNANTTTSQDSESNDVEAPDLLNKYGSQVVVEYLRDNPEIYEKMGGPLKKAGQGGGRVQTNELDEYKPQEDDARKITGYVALLTTKEQEEFYDDVVRRYNELIKYLNDTGNNDLKITVMPLRAKTLNKRVSSEGIDPTGTNPFARNSYVEQVEMDVLRKPMKAAEIRKTIEQVNKGKRPEDYIRQVIATIEKEDEVRIAAEEARYERSKAKAQEDIAKQTEKINRQQKRTAEEKQAAIADYVRETNENVETKHNDNMVRLNTNSDMLKQRLHMFEVGKSYLMPDNLESMVFDFSTPAIFCGYKAKDSKITASTTLAVFATLDGRRRMEIKLSQPEALRSIYKTTNDNWDAARSTTLENWDSQIPTGTRKTGFIMTGNILQAIADTQDEHGGYPGQLISYTDIDGNVHDGILMPDKWNTSMLKTSGAPIISRLQQIKEYKPVTSHDGKVEIMGSSWAKTYYLTVPKTKKDGAVYYQNEELLHAVNGGNFYPYRGKLRADIPAENIESVVKELSKLGVRVQQEEAKEEDVLYRNDDELSEANELFNEELRRYHIGEMDKNEMFHLGNPNGVMRTFLPDLPIVMRQRVVNKGSNRKHDVDVTALLNMPVRISEPIFVFKKNDDSVGILTEMKDRNGRNVFVAFDIASTIQDGGEYLEVNDVTTVHGRRVANIVRPILENNSLQWVNKKKALNWFSSASPDVQQEITNTELISAANIVKNFENPNVSDENLRLGNGVLTDDDLSNANDPVSKLLGKSTRTARQRRAFAERERVLMVERVQELAETLHLDNVDIVTDASTLQGKRAKAKGFYSRGTGRITIVIPNHSSVYDAEQTLLHEAVAHFGLRELFGEHFDTFLENVFQNADMDVRRHIVGLAERNGWNFRTATEEYLASLAENTNFENVNASWWSKIKELFLRMLHKIGFEDFSGVTLSDNELRYILWRSYENLAEPGRYRSILGTARDMAKQHELGVGNYAANTSGRQADAAADMAGEPSVEEVNRQFNEELEQQIAGDLPDGHIYEMGMPSNVLLSTGVPNFPIQMNANRLQSKATSYGHDFDLTEVKDLVKALQHPLAVFAYGDKTKAQNIIVSLQKDGKNFIVGLSLNPSVGGRKLEINSIRNVFPKNNAEWLNWITQGKALYLNKEKLQDLIDQQRTILADVEYLDLDSAANIVKNFENPKIGTENVDNDVLFRKAEEAENSLNANWRDEYDQRTLSTAFKFREAAQDGMLSVSVLQDVISKETKSPIKEIENVWGLQNRLSSTNKFEQDYFYENYYKPLIREVGNLVKAGAQYNELGIIAESGYKDILKYLVSKHGIERNAHFRDVAAAEARLPFVEQIENTMKSADAGTITQESADKMIEALTKEMEEAERRSRALTAKRDYSGLSELFSESESFETAAQEYVSAFESNFDTTRLWNKINAATKATLRKTYESGLISKSQYEATRDMYDYYIPLRGWSNDVASELYNYKGQQGVGGRIMKRAKGRKSLAENPLAVIGRMGQDGILQANKNLVKQRLYNLAAGHETSLLTIKRQWYVNNGTDENPDWQRAYPELLADMDADEVNDALTAFENKMKELQKAGRATQRRDGLTLGYHTTSAQEQQHRVNASIGGREYNIYVNGNPRAAQAINGELRMDEGDTSYVQKANRWLANVYTSLNPEFVVTNYERDAGFAAAIVAATESSHYQAAWAKNMALFNPITSGAYLYRLINKATNGKINSDNKIEKYMLEFLANGGETGFTNMLTADDYKKLVKREIRNVNIGITPRKAYRITTEAVQRLNRVFEDATRFSTYVTSREQGRSIDRAISDAKEISLNFNTRGADGMRNDGIIHKFFRNLRHWVIFTNPSIQGLNKAGVAFKNHPVRSTIAIAGLPALLGYGMAALASSLLGDDDDEKVRSAYMDLPKWVRRTNICIPIGDTKFVTIPLSYELRVSYGMGEMFWEIEQGMIEPGELAKETLTQLSDLLPVSFASGSVAHNASPTLVSPLVDIIQNMDFTGRPLWRENTFNQGMPEYTKAYAGTAKWLTKSTEVLNNAIPKFWEKDYPSPDKYTPGALDINPAGVEHLLDSYLGGLYTFPAKAAKTISMIWDEDMRDIRNVPFFNRNIKDSRSGNPIDRSAGDRYNTYMGEYRLSKQRWNGYRRETKHGVPDFVKKLTEFGNTPQGQRMFIIDGYIKSINALDKEIRDMGEYDGYGSDAERKRLKNMSNSLKQELVNKLDSVSVMKNQQIKPAQYLHKYQYAR